MSRRVPEHANRAAHEIGEALLLAALVLIRKPVNCKHGRIAVKGATNKRTAVIREASLLAQLVHDALDRFEHGVKVIVSQQFLAAEIQNVGVYIAPREIGAQFLCATSGRCQRLGHFRLTEFAGFVDFKPSERQSLIEVCPQRLEAFRVAYIALGLHRVADEAEYLAAVLAPVLVGRKRVIEANAFRDSGIGVFDLARSEEVADLRAFQPLAGMAERGGDGLKLGLREVFVLNLSQGHFSTFRSSGCAA